MLHHFKIIPFIAGIVIGFVIVTYYKPPPSIVYEYPHPQNMNNRVYRDKNGVCYSYKSTPVDCDANEGTLKQYPLQG
jgi:hypothetical protein